MSSRDQGASPRTALEKTVFALTATATVAAFVGLVLWFIARVWGVPGVVVFLLLFFFWAQMTVRRMVELGWRPWTGETMHQAAKRWDNAHLPRR
ncbi:MAG: hypothetical protein OYK82_06240 [Gammaproteobacteria bacterium]|nr:hypothetical protein [Gammaproteobacteria bacterium]